jgi:hypothetical protein
MQEESQQSDERNERKEESTAMLQWMSGFMAHKRYADETFIRLSKLRIAMLRKSRTIYAIGTIGEILIGIVQYVRDGNIPLVLALALNAGVFSYQVIKYTQYLSEEKMNLTDLISRSISI